MSSNKNSFSYMYYIGHYPGVYKVYCAKFILRDAGIDLCDGRQVGVAWLLQTGQQSGTLICMSVTTAG